MARQAELVVASGVESMSKVPMGGNLLIPNASLMDTYPAAHVAMGTTAENVAVKYGITREEQDAFSLDSHIKAARAQADGKFAPEIIPVDAVRVKLDEQGRPVKTTTRFVSFASAGVDPNLMGIGPVAAIPKALQLAGISQEEIDLIELNEAFASQSLACIRELKLNPKLVNVNGVAIALGHPLACTGSFLTCKLLPELARRGGRYGLVSMCIGGGMGAAAVLERI